MIGKVWALGARVFPDSVLHPNRWIVRVVALTIIWVGGMVVGGAAFLRLAGSGRLAPWTDVFRTLAVALCAVVAMLCALLWPPTASAKSERGERVLRVAAWRWIAFPLSVGIPIGLIILDGEGWDPFPWGYMSVPMVLVAFGAFGFRVEHLTWSDRGITRSGLLGSRQTLEWHEVAWVLGNLQGARLVTDAGRWVAVPGFMLDGWPEFAAAVLVHLPSAAFEASSGAREKLEIAASRYRAHRG